LFLIAVTLLSALLGCGANVFVRGASNPNVVSGTVSSVELSTVLDGGIFISVTLVILPADRHFYDSDILRRSNLPVSTPSVHASQFHSWTSLRHPGADRFELKTENLPVSSRFMSSPGRAEFFATHLASAAIDIMVSWLLT
jgi:hypothetical protein